MYATKADFSCCTAARNQTPPLQCHIAAALPLFPNPTHQHLFHSTRASLSHHTHRHPYLSQPPPHNRLPLLQHPPSLSVLGFSPPTASLLQHPPGFSLPTISLCSSTNASSDAPHLSLLQHQRLFLSQPPPRRHLSLPQHLPGPLAPGFSSQRLARGWCTAPPQPASLGTHQIPATVPTYLSQPPPHLHASTQFRHIPTTESRLLPSNRFLCSSTRHQFQYLTSLYRYLASLLLFPPTGMQLGRSFSLGTHCLPAAMPTYLSNRLPATMTTAS